MAASLRAQRTRLVGRIEMTGDGTGMVPPRPIVVVRDNAG
jgi:hypothetical protein